MSFTSASTTINESKVFPTFTCVTCRRRTLKNRGYAASCRIKRLEQKDELESEKGKEFEDLDKMQVELQVTNHFLTKYITDFNNLFLD